MARRKCYHCEGRFPEEYTKLTRAMTGGSYRSAAGNRPVRACYRCIAKQAFRNVWTRAMTQDPSKPDLPWRDRLANLGWYVPDETEVEKPTVHRVFDALWPDGDWAPLYPDTVPAHFIPDAPA